LNCFLQFPERAFERTQAKMAFSGNAMDKLFKDAGVDEKVANFKSNLPPLPRTVHLEKQPTKLGKQKSPNFVQVWLMASMKRCEQFILINDTSLF
jgi:hypothetical protein